MRIACNLIARFTDNTLYSANASFCMVDHRVSYFVSDMPQKRVVHAELSVELGTHRHTFDFNYHTGQIPPEALNKLLKALYETMTVILKSYEPETTV